MDAGSRVWSHSSQLAKSNSGAVNHHDYTTDTSTLGTREVRDNGQLIDLVHRLRARAGK
jgi:hypothetical protein